MSKNTLLNERYEIKEILGCGGFATTYLAVDKETQQQCAIKCLSFRKIEEWKTWELFEREAKILKELDHPQIPKYIDFFSMDLDDLLVRSCKWLHGYLKNNPNVSEEDRGICDDILATAKDAKEREVFFFIFLRVPSRP